MILCVLRTSTLFAERWPFLLGDVQTLYQEYEKVDDTYISILYVVSQGPVYASASGLVHVSSVRLNNNLSVANHSQLSIKTDSGLHISYHGIRNLRDIGEAVEEGDIVGEVDGKWYMRIFDERTRQWVDSFSVFPDMERKVSIRIFDFSFARTQDALPPRSVSDLRIYAGENEVHLDFELVDRDSQNYLVPDSILLKVGSFSRLLYKQEILSFMDFESLRSNKRIKLTIPNISVARGYHIINLDVSSPVRAMRAFKFSVFAEQAPAP